MPDAGEDRADRVERPRRVGRQRIDEPPAEQDDRPTTSAWKMNAARQLIAVVITPPISGPAAAPMPPSPLITPNAQAREVRSLNHSVARM